MTRRAVVAVFVIFFAAGCATAPPRCELGPPRAPGDPLVWRADKPGAPGTIYLFGTIHTVGIADVAPTVLALVDGATRFASELGDTAPDADALRTLARLPPGSALLDRQLARDDWFELENALRGAMKRDELQHARPWFAMMQLLGRVAPAPRPSMDVALAERARAHHVPVEALERWEAQLAALDAAVTVQDLADTIHERARLACSQERLRAAYLARDLPALARTLRVRDNRLLADRNRAWLAQLEAYAATPGTTVVAVGLGHLLGPDSLVALLARDGFTVAPSGQSGQPSASVRPL